MSLIKRSVIRALSQRIMVNSRKRVIFIYHDVSDPEDAHHTELYSTPIDVFRQHLEFLTRHFRLVSLDDILSPNVDGRKERLAAITFDDGFLSVKDSAFPLLAKQGVPFTVFLNRLAITENRLYNGSEQGKLERPSEKKVFLDEQDVSFLSQQGVVVGSHSSTHRSLVNCDDACLREEIDGNKQYLEQLLGHRVRHLALPFGKREHYDKKVLDYCFKTGHDYVYSSNPTFFYPPPQPHEEKPIPRIGLTNQKPEEIIFMINRPLLKIIDL